MKALAAAAAALALTGCAALGPKPALPADFTAATVPLYCMSAEQCMLYWQRAQVWIANNSRWKIQLATDTLIETYNGVGESRDPGFRLLRVPQSNGWQELELTLACRSMFGCEHDRATYVASFKRYVRGEL